MNQLRSFPFLFVCSVSVLYLVSRFCFIVLSVSLNSSYNLNT